MTAEQPLESRTQAERPLVVFSLDGQRYALPLARVLRSILAAAVTRLPGAPAIVRGSIDLGDGAIPVIDLRERFNHRPRNGRMFDHLLVASTGTRTVALLVDETRGIIEASPGHCTPAREIPPRLEHVDGAVRLEDGLILIHDLERLLSPPGRSDFIGEGEPWSIS